MDTVTLPGPPQGVFAAAAEITPSVRGIIRAYEQLYEATRSEFERTTALPSSININAPPFVPFHHNQNLKATTSD